MNDKLPKLKALAIRGVRLAKPSRVNLDKAHAAAMTTLSRAFDNADELQKQADLLHVEVVLVSEGINDNDDVFTRAELKQALSSPLLKPMNWKHKDSEILGAMYAVEARDFEGNRLTAEEIDDQPIELIIQGVIWHHLSHIKTTAEQIVARIEKDDLFVSMECWFDNYNYALYTKAGEFEDTIARNSDTAFLDTYLRVNGGAGIYNGRRIGRALEGISFGGIAFVDRPANKRSFILNHFVFDPTEMLEPVNAENDGLEQDQVVTNNVVSNDKPLVVNMNDLNRAAASADEIQDAVKNALDSRKSVEDAEQTVKDLESATAQKADLEKQLKEAKATLEKLQATIETTYAGATTSTPKEIATIDDAINSGSDVYAAKLAWIDGSRAKAVEIATKKSDAEADTKLIEENEKLKAENTSLKNDIRKADIEYLFATVLSMDEEKVAKFVETGLAQASDEDYQKWLDEKKVFATEILEARKPDSEAGLLEPMQRETSIDDNGAVLRSEHGKVPTSMNTTPRSKISAELTELFEVVEGPNLAGANAAANTPVPAMTSLVGSFFATASDKKEDE